MTFSNDSESYRIAIRRLSQAGGTEFILISHDKSGPPTYVTNSDDTEKLVSDGMSYRKWVLK